jgi:hypothetical protein
LLGVRVRIERFGPARPLGGAQLIGASSERQARARLTNRQLSWREPRSVLVQVGDAQSAAAQEPLDRIGQ